MLVKPHSNNGPYAIAAATFLLVVCSLCYYTFRDCVSWNRGLSVAFKVSFYSLTLCFLFLSASLDQRAKSFVFELHSPLCLSLEIFFSLSFTSHRLSLTKFSGTSPPVHRRDLARQRGRLHVTSGYSCVKSGTRFGRAHSRVYLASMHAPFIIGTASKRMPKAAKFCCVYTYYVALRAQTRVLLHHPRILLFLLKLP